jgi:hypothetical protein
MDSEELTPEERLERIIELLAEASAETGPETPVLKSHIERQEC